MEEKKWSDLRYERETTIVFNEQEDEAMVWSASPSFQRKMTKANISPYKTAQRERGEQSCWYKVPRQWVRIRKPIARMLTEEQKIQMAERAKRQFSRPGKDN